MVGSGFFCECVCFFISSFIYHYFVVLFTNFKESVAVLFIILKLKIKKCDHDFPDFWVGRERVIYIHKKRKIR